MAVFMTKWSEWTAFPNLGKKPPFMDHGSALSRFDIFARHRVFDKTAYALSPRLGSNVLFDV